jgi:adenylate cyclase
VYETTLRGPPGVRRPEAACVNSPQRFTSAQTWTSAQASRRRGVRQSTLQVHQRTDVDQRTVLAAAAAVGVRPVPTCRSLAAAGYDPGDQAAARDFPISGGGHAGHPAAARRCLGGTEDLSELTGRPSRLVLHQYSAAVDVDRLIEVGLYDPSSPDAADRLELLRYVADSGASLEEIQEADRSGNLVVLPFNRKLAEGDQSAVDLAERAGATVEEVLEAYRLLGIPSPDTNAPVFSFGEERLLELLAAARSVLSDETSEEIMRSIGAGLAVMADSAVTAFMGSVEQGLEEVRLADRAKVTTAAGELGLELGTALGPLLRHHLLAAVHRHRATLRWAVDRRESELSVGFVDLVGFTPMTERMGAGELLAFVSTFRNRTFDLVTQQGGRVVKHIGDEIMFTAPDPAAACEMALTLVDGFTDLDSPPRGGLAHGVVVARHGDLYGTTVNLAARLADVAVPGEVLAAEAISSLATDRDLEFERAGRRQLKGFQEPVPVVSVRRSPRDPRAGVDDALANRE